MNSLGKLQPARLSTERTPADDLPASCSDCCAITLRDYNIGVITRDYEWLHFSWLQVSNRDFGGHEGLLTPRFTFSKLKQHMTVCQRNARPRSPAAWDGDPNSQNAESEERKWMQRAPVKQTNEWYLCRRFGLLLEEVLWQGW